MIPTEEGEQIKRLGPNEEIKRQEGICEIRKLGSYRKDRARRDRGIQGKKSRVSRRSRVKGRRRVQKIERTGPYRKSREETVEQKILSEEGLDNTE